MRATAFSLILFLAGCCTTQPNRDYRASGYVRNIWARDAFYVTFEHDTGAIQVFRFGNQPPVWAGEHYIIGYHPDPSGFPYDICDWAKRDR